MSMEKAKKADQMDQTDRTDQVDIGVSVHPAFSYTNPDNFVAIADGVTFGASEGWAISTETWETQVGLVNWAASHSLFFKGLAERLDRFKELAETGKAMKGLWKGKERSE